MCHSTGRCFQIFDWYVSWTRVLCTFRFFKSIQDRGGGDIAEFTTECDYIARSMRCCVDIICRPSGETGNCLAGIQEQQSKLFFFFFWSASFSYDVTTWDRERKKKVLDVAAGSPHTRSISDSISRPNGGKGDRNSLPQQFPNGFCVFFLGSVTTPVRSLQHNRGHRVLG